jgi:hypothetical protein
MPARREVMNKIVLDRYPVERLPDDMQVGVRHAEAVKVTLEPLKSALSAQQWLEDIERRRAALTPTTDDLDARLRHLRDEWDG